MKYQRTTRNQAQGARGGWLSARRCSVLGVLVGVVGQAHAQEAYEDSIIIPSMEVAHSFGSSLALENGVLAIGAVNQPASILSMGGMIESSTVFPEGTDLDSIFGFDVELEHGIMAVSASFEGNTDQISGAVYLYDVSSGQLLHRIVPSEGNEVADFGLSIAMDDGKLVVGYQKGFFVYDAVSGALIDRFELTSLRRFFSNASEVVDGKVILGVPSDNSTSGFDTGSVYVYDIDTGAELMKLEADDAIPSAHFGASLAVDDGMLVVGATGAGHGEGAVYVYDLATGSLISRLMPLSDDGFAGPRFGQAVDIDDGIVVVGTPNGRDTESLFGMVQLFDAQSGLQTANLLVNNSLNDGRRFGKSVLIDSGVVIVGATDTNTVLVYSMPAFVCIADINDDGSLNFFDVSAFIAGLTAQDPSVDLNNDGSFDFFDVSLFLNVFAGGCP